MYFEDTFGPFLKILNLIKSVSSKKHFLSAIELGFLLKV